MERVLKEILSIRSQIEALNTCSKSCLEELEASFDLKDLGNVKETLKRAKSLLEQRPKFLVLSEGVRKTYDFHCTCRKQLKSSEAECKEIQEALRRAVKGAESALTVKLDDYLKKFPIQAVEEARNYITEMKISHCQPEAKFTDDELLSPIEFFIKVLPDENMSMASDSASQESKIALKSLADAFELASKIVSPIGISGREIEMPDFEVLANNAKKSP